DARRQLFLADFEDGAGGGQRAVEGRAEGLVDELPRAATVESWDEVFLLEECGGDIPGVERAGLRLVLPVVLQAVLEQAERGGERVEGDEVGVVDRSIAGEGESFLEAAFGEGGFVAAGGDLGIDLA